MSRTNGSGVFLRAAASSGADLPSVDAPTPRISSMTAAACVEIVEHADARSDSRVAGSSSSRSIEAHATGRSSISAHSASIVDLPYPAGAVTPTTRASLARAFSMSSRRLTPPSARVGTRTFPRSRSCCRSSRDATDSGFPSITVASYGARRSQQTSTHRCSAHGHCCDTIPRLRAADLRRITARAPAQRPASASRSGRRAPQRRPAPPRR